LQSETPPEVEIPPYPGYLIRVGASGSNVLLMQRYLNMISNRYPSIPKLTQDGVFGTGTKNAVAAFQRQFGLSPDRNNRTFNMGGNCKRSE
jgi:peptidoglycan hydrolase-like protein with peptidoglycan-binding domain